MGQRVHLSPCQGLRTSASELEKHRVNTKNTRIRDRQAVNYKNTKELSMISEVIRLGNYWYDLTWVIDEEI